MLTRRRLLLLAWVMLWLALIAVASKTVLDRLPVPPEDHGRAQGQDTLRTRDRIPLLLGLIADDRPYVFGERRLYAVLAVAYATVLAAFFAAAGWAAHEEGRP